MIRVMYGLSDLSIFAIIFLVTLIVSYIAVMIIKHFFTINANYEDNEVTGNVISLIGIIYGVLAGITALYLLNNIDYANEIVQKEVNAAANIFQDSNLLPPAPRNEIQTKLKEYLDTVINVEWPLMSVGKIAEHDSTTNIMQLFHVIHKFNHDGQANVFLIQDLFGEVKTLYNSHEHRVQMSKVSLSKDLWIVILVGTFLTVASNFFFRMHMRLHILLLIAEVVMASSMIFLLITLDKPFQGQFNVDAQSFQTLLDYMNQHPG